MKGFMTVVPCKYARTVPIHRDREKYFVPHAKTDMLVRSDFPFKARLLNEKKLSRDDLISTNMYKHVVEL